MYRIYRQTEEVGIFKTLLQQAGKIDVQVIESAGRWSWKPRNIARIIPTANGFLGLVQGESKGPYGIIGDMG